MDFNNPLILSNILNNEELEQLNEAAKEKLKKYFENFFDEYCKEKAAASRLEQVEQQGEELKSEIEDYKLKLENFEKNVNELRDQLSACSLERASLLEAAKRNEIEYTRVRQEKNNLAEERDSLLKVIDRQNIELERLHQDTKVYQQQLKAAISAKCTAIAKVDEIESKEISIDFKEKRMEQERALFQSQIQTLTEDLNRNISELQNLRREHKSQSMHIETQLSEKIEELKIVQSQNVQYKENIERLTQNVQELTTKILHQNEEANKMMEYYKRELEAKTKLADLYKDNCDDNEMERAELETAITDLKRMLHEASDQYGELETKLKAMGLQHEQDIEEKNRTIESLKLEITHANDLLKEVQQESVENALTKLAPSAAVASRLIRTDMSLTELYSLYAKATEDLELQKRENSRLNLQLKSILHELSENAPVIKKQEIEYEKLVEGNNILSRQRDELLSKKCELEEMCENARSKINHLERENKKLRQAQTDLSRQVCYLLKEVEQLRVGLSSDKNAPTDANISSSEECISKKFITFKNIAELQEQNNKLIILVRELSTKLEEAELARNDITEGLLNEKLEGYAKKLTNMQDILNKQNNTVATLVAKCERYKKLYFDLQKAVNKNGSNDLSDCEDIEMDSAEKSEGNLKEKPCRKESEKDSEAKIKELEHQINEAMEKNKILKEQYDFYIKEKNNNEKILNEQFDSMRNELRELTSNNCKLLSTVEYNKEQIKLQLRNIATYKQQISTLEERNKNYENTIFKHEQTVNYLRDEIMKSQRNQSSAEAEANHLRHENQILKDTASRLQSEKEAFNREQRNQVLLLNNLEIIKSNLERSEMEGKARMEQRLDETVRELSAQRRRFQEEEDRFRESLNDMKRRTESANKALEEEKAISSKLQNEVSTLREDLISKSQQIENLSKKLQECLTPSLNENPITAANKKIRELELQLEEAKIEITSLNNELSKVREHAEQYYKMSQSAESEIKALHEGHTEYIKKTDTEISTLKQLELNLRSRIEELQAENQLATVSESLGNNSPDELKQLQGELKDALQKLGECNRSLRVLRQENSEILEQLGSVEKKYANEMMLHSVDIQELSKLKYESTKVQNEIDDLKTERDKVKSAYEELMKTHTNDIEMLQKEKAELEKRIDDLNTLNSNLHEQIEALASKLALLSSTSSINNSHHEHSMDTSICNSELNRSQAEEENKNNEQLLQIIKFLRKEKDLTIAKLDILKAENARLVSEMTILQKRVDELNGFLLQERSKSESNITSAMKHEEILRKIETLNAITDSNRILREERNALSVRVKELTEQISKMEDELFPLQNQSRDLSMKVEELTAENTSLRTEAMKWRQRANLLVEKSNKNPEEFKRLQLEREQLSKLLNNEKDNLRKTLEELSVVKHKVDIDIPTLEKNVQTLNDEKRKHIEELAGVKQNNTRMLQEIMELKNKLLQKEDELQKCSTEIAAKENLYQDLKSKEMQIRKIAKRYKDSYLEMMNKMPNVVTATDLPKDGVTESPVNNDGNGIGSGDSGPSATNISNVDTLNSMIKTMQEENEKLRKEYDDLKAAVEVDEQTKTLLRDARSKIVSLTESKNVISQELANTKNKLQTVMQSSENQDSIISGIKADYEESLSRLEKELTEQTNMNKEAITRLTRENESLVMRISQLSRQLGLQQSAKPSTSTVAITEKGCITESSPRTANVKPMSGTATLQQSATVTPWRGGETPLASIRPISVQNSRTAAILPTSQQQSTSGTSSSSSSSSSAATTSVQPPSVGNTALVPPQQQVHTTGSNSLETMSSSPTSSHTDYMPSTSSASVAVATIPPMGSAGTAAESSHEAESVQQQQGESQLFSGTLPQQAVALVSPRVEGTQNVATATLNQNETGNPQPSTSGTSSTSHIAVSSHSRHTPSSSSVTTSQAGSSVGHKRPRDTEGDSSSTSNDDCGGDKINKMLKRMRNNVHVDEADANIGDMEIDVDQVPTSSQRDQEDDIVVVDSDEDVVNEVDDGPTETEAENEVYENAYIQGQDIEENDCPELNVSENNEVDADVGCSENQVECIQDRPVDEIDETGSSTSKTSTFEQDNQQSQTITSGSSEQIPVVPVSNPNWKQATSSTHSNRAQEGSSSEIVSSPQESIIDAVNSDCEVPNKSGDTIEKTETEPTDADQEQNKEVGEADNDNSVSEVEDVEEYAEENLVTAESEENITEGEDQLTIGVTQSEMHDIQQSQIEEENSEDIEVADNGVTSEGEKQVIDEVEEEGREAEASTSPSITTRSKTTRGTLTPRRLTRGVARGGSSRPTPIIWQDSPGTSRNSGQSPTQMRGFPSQRNQRGRRMRRPGGSFTNIRFQ